MKKNRRIYIILTIAVLMIASNVMLFGRYQYDYFEDDSYSPPAYEDPYNERQENTQAYSDKYLPMPQYRWPRIRIFGPTSAVIVYVAVIFGAAMYLIGYNAGAKLNKGAIITSIVLATSVAIVARSFALWIQLNLYKLLFSLGQSRILAASMAEAIVYMVWMFYITGISVMLYEAFTVTAKEAHPMT